MAKTYGYARVSTREQHEDRQVDALLGFGVIPRNIFLDKMSGKDFERPRYQRLVHSRLKRGDLLVVKSIDRLGRNYDEIIEEWRFITKIVRADVVVLDMPLLDTRVDEGSLVGVFIADVVLQREGIRAAKARGVRFGRPRRVLPDDFPEVAAMWKGKDITIHEALELTEMPRSSFYAAAKRHLEQLTEAAG